MTPKSPSAEPGSEHFSLVASLRRKEQMPAAERAALAKAWREENRAAIEAYNTRIENDGCFGDDEARLF